MGSSRRLPGTAMVPGDTWTCFGRVACRFAGMLKYELKPRSLTRRTKATSATDGCGGSSAGDNEGPRQGNSRPWNATTRITQQPGREIGLQKGLSRMRGNSHVRFLEGLGARKSPWPTRRRPWIQLCLHKVRRRIGDRLSRKLQHSFSRSRVLRHAISLHHQCAVKQMVSSK
jgi:hypothetical protein